MTLAEEVNVAGLAFAHRNRKLAFPATHLISEGEIEIADGIAFHRGVEWAQKRMGYAREAR